MYTYVGKYMRIYIMIVFACALIMHYSLCGND